MSCPSIQRFAPRLSLGTAFDLDIAAFMHTEPQAKAATTAKREPKRQFSDELPSSTPDELYSWPVFPLQPRPGRKSYTDFIFTVRISATEVLSLRDDRTTTELEQMKHLSQILRLSVLTSMMAATQAQVVSCCDQHNNGANLSFADGHAEHHRWRFNRTNIPNGPNRVLITRSADRTDVRWLQQGISHTLEMGNQPNHQL